MGGKALIKIERERGFTMVAVGTIKLLRAETASGMPMECPPVGGKALIKIERERGFTSRRFHATIYLML